MKKVIKYILMAPFIVLYGFVELLQEYDIWLKKRKDKKDGD